MMDFEAMMKQAMQNIENNVYNEMMMEAFGWVNNETDEVGFAFILALNRRGVSSKTIFEAFNEVAKEFNKADE